MASITFSIPSSLAVQGSVTISGLTLGSSGNYRLLIGSDYAVMGADLSGFQPGGGAIQTGVVNNQRVIGNFTMVSTCQRYFWTGTSLSTGILPAPLALSGFNFVVKNLTPSVNLLISGSIDYGQNMVLPPFGSYSFNSDGLSWIQI